ncbi:hypothetical protein BX283_0315 [Streptomyces sp. TLI_146]|nr:hypothetical protein BX283_0315 [Streptomyces sp. TLI_146]
MRVTLTLDLTLNPAAGRAGSVRPPVVQLRVDGGAA